ncbi:MAG: V-type ATP synthase subunit A [Candidatus Undinarchaeales archaeon]|jgi:V/A-type H+-transporting ATPase subunit A|nr:V-type ATP synthase subunit A [Candidatus Undinarchaeales archaeon]MDP7492160.1 V-type ATP synthase subunit A [Candidatus Undinarchaeales archaeon]
MAIEGKIVKVAGPVIDADEMKGVKMFDVVRVGKQGLIGEVIGLLGAAATIQVYEETSGLSVGEPVVSTGMPLSVELGPGLMGAIFDGIQRPLQVIKEKAGEFIIRGVEADPLDRKKTWVFEPRVKKGDTVKAGDVVGVVQESALVEHKILVPSDADGSVASVTKKGEYVVEDVMAVIKTPEGERQVNMLQKWPVRRGRPYKEKLAPHIPLITGQRILDTFFPIAKGGTACIPGPFGSGKTVTQHQLAKWADTDIIVYIGCGERGNEMTDVLREFPELKDPKSGLPLMDRTVLIANTSNMPVAAREASIYTGITLAEYYRDMGYSVGLMADSTSRWAEALREISGRLEEMPGEEGYPAYLASKVAAFYERAGRVITLGTDEREGSLTVVGAVSPPGGDFSEPVTQNTLRITKVFWALDAKLADRRHFPSINWLQSYSLYLDDVEEWWRTNVSAEWKGLRKEAMKLLQKEAELEEIVKLVGPDALRPSDRFLLETTRSIREDFLQQNAFHEVDTYTSGRKQLLIMGLILKMHNAGLGVLAERIPLADLLAIPVRERIARTKFVKEEEIEAHVKNLEDEMQNQVLALVEKYGGEKRE